MRVKGVPMSSASVVDVIYTHIAFQFLFLTHSMLAGCAAGFHE